MDTRQNAVPALQTHCCIAGCGPAGAILGFLLARLVCSCGGGDILIYEGIAHRDPRDD